MLEGSKNILTRLKGDKYIWAIVALLSLFSLLLVYSSTGNLAYRYRQGNTEFYLFWQFSLLASGIILMYITYMMHYTRFSRVGPILLAISVPLLIYTLAFGVDLNDAKRWILLPILNITFQTSDLAKLALIIYVARAISGKQEYIKDFNSAFIPIILPVVVVCGLIAPADLSSSILLFVTCTLLMFIGRVDMKFIAIMVLFGIVLFAFLIILGKFFPDYIRVETWVSRTQDFITNKEGSFQIQQAKIAISEGGLFGVGPGNSFQKYHTPHAYSDLIYSIIIAEYGLIGGLVVLSLYVALFLRCVRLVTRSPKAFGAMLAMGLSLSLVIQALVNMAVPVHLVPVTGVTLPMISMGGSSLWFTCIMLGMILSVSKNIESVHNTDVVMIPDAPAEGEVKNG